MAHQVLYPSMVQRQRARRRGFTLVELSVVVAIIGILAVLAIVGYRKYVLYTKITEAQNVISAIKIAQEDYRGEKGSYANVGPSWCPAGAGTSTQKVFWDPNCGSGPGTPPVTWLTLPVHVDGPVQFAYQTLAGPSGFDGSSVTFVTWTAANTTVPWYLIHAKCDLDGSDTGVIDTEFAVSNLTNQVFSINEGR